MTSLLFRLIYSGHEYVFHVPTTRKAARQISSSANELPDIRRTLERSFHS